MAKKIKNHIPTYKRDSQAPLKAKKRVGFFEWLIHGTGTVEEPWPTAEELFENKEVRHEIAEIQQTLATMERKKK